MPTPTPTPLRIANKEQMDAHNRLLLLADSMGLSYSAVLDAIQKGALIGPEVVNDYEVVYGPIASPTSTATAGLPWEQAAEGQINPQPTSIEPLGAGEGQGSNMEAILKMWNAAIATPTATATPGPSPTPGTTPWATYEPTPTAQKTIWATDTQVPTGTPRSTLTATPTTALSPTATSTALPPTALSPTSTALPPTTTPPTPPSPTATALSPTATSTSEPFGYRPPDNLVPGTWGGYDMWNPVNFLDQFFGRAQDQAQQVFAGPTSDYDYPQRQTQMGKFGTTVARYSEWLLDRMHKNEYEELQNEMQRWRQIYGSSRTPQELEGAQRGMAQTEAKMAELQNRIQTGAGDVRAIPAIMENPSLITQLGDIAAGYPGEFGWQPSADAGPGSYPVQMTQTLDGTTVKPTAVGTYNPALDSANPFGYLEPAAATSAQPFGTTNAAAPGQPAAPTAAQPISSVGSFLPITQQPVIGDDTYPPHGSPWEHRGMYDEGGLETYEGPPGYGGIPGVPTLGGFRGFETYKDLRETMDQYGRSGEMFGRRDFREYYGNQMSAPDSLRTYMKDFRNADIVDSFRGGQVYRVDLGQGIQDYRVRFDNYGNVKSYVPA